MKKVKNIRFIVQMTMLITVIFASLNHYLSTTGMEIPWISESIFHYICPICGVTSIYQFFASSTLWVVKLKSTLGIIIGLVIILSMIFGPVICGFICPFGALQDLVARMGKKINKRKYNKFVPKKLDNKLKYLRYLTLIVAVYLTAISKVTLLESVNPYHAFLGLFKQSVSIIGLLVLIIILIASLFIQRPWCKYLCPYGAFLGLFNKVKVFRIIRKDSTCVSCKKCSNSCPMSINIVEKNEIRDLSCISCFECVDKKVCPKSNTIMCSSDDLDIEEIDFKYTENMEDYINEK